VGNDTLTCNVEILALIGASGINGTDNRLGNAITGNAANDEKRRVEA